MYKRNNLTNFYNNTDSSTKQLLSSLVGHRDPEIKIDIFLDQFYEIMELRETLSSYGEFAIK